MRSVESIPIIAAKAPVTSESPTLQERDRDLLALFEDLGPGRLDALDGVWDLCAADLHGLALWRTGSSQDAEDALQEVFIRLARAAQEGRLRGVRKPFPYLLQMAHRAAIDTLRQRQRHQWSELQEAPDLLQADPDRIVEATRISHVLARLPEGQRAVVYLKHFVELSFREIAGVMGIPTFTAASRYRLALRRLRRMMGVES